MIINSVGVDSYQLGCGLEEIKEKIKDLDFTEEELDNHFTISTDSIKFWIDKDQSNVTQISVFGEYTGKFLKKIGIGSTLSDLNDLGIKWVKEDYVYKLPEYPGVCFELEDIDDWNEIEAPIQFISIYCE
ncbi:MULTISPECIES: hypothetical protein [Paenibacillus]|uniref:Uncharacterized protein n=1 Tax=Paenibacillus lactis TaxID=228574 RepID=A0ABS4F543_9BACL|nr:hypothetical protein [Paenibacillus lactis]MBP1891365.1 hypothetical protein [Paenibacillus lactis]HAF98263.1 hypothetical protein [Paenibacillus lactis]